MMSNQRSPKIAVTFLRCDVEAASVETSRKTAREVSSISARARCVVNMLESRDDAAVD